MFKASVQVRFETQVHNHWVMVAVDVCVDAVKAFEDLADGGGEVCGEAHA